MFATIYLPSFYLQAAIRHHPKLRAQPVALIDASEKKVAIIELNDAAEKAGITKGMTPSQALARCLHVVIRARERAQENVAEILLQHAFMLSPFVEATASEFALSNLPSRDLTAKLSRVVRSSRNAKFMPKGRNPHHRLTPVIWRRIGPTGVANRPSEGISRAAANRNACDRVRTDRSGSAGDPPQAAAGLRSINNP
jgi:hypothetical protein